MEHTLFHWTQMTIKHIHWISLTHFALGRRKHALFFFNLVWGLFIWVYNLHKCWKTFQRLWTVKSINENRQKMWFFSWSFCFQNCEDTKNSEDLGFFLLLIGINHICNSAKTFSSLVCGPPPNYLHFIKIWNFLIDS